MPVEMLALLSALALTPLLAGPAPDAVFVASAELGVYSLVSWSEGSAPKALATIRVPDDVELLAAAVAPDRKAAYLATQKGDKGAAFQRLDLTNGAMIPLRTTDLWDVDGIAVRPDGGEIVFGGFNDKGVRLIAMSADGKSATALTEPGFGSFPTYSPDGRRIAFQAEEASDTGISIWVFNRSSGQMTRLTRADQRATQPAWSPDGSRIAFLWSDDDFDRWPELHTMRADGSDPKVVCEDLPESSISRIAYSADGTSVLALAAFEGLGRINLATGKYSAIADEPSALPDVLLWTGR